MNSPHPADSPGVWFPPPFIYLTTFGVSWWLNRVWPTQLISESFVADSALVAKPLVVAGVVLAMAGLFSFAKHRTTIEPSKKASKLITDGLYRISRNPIYLGFTAMYLAATLRTNNTWALLCLLPVLAIMNRHVIAREERHLTAVFGDSYRAYCQKVRRWL